MKGLSRGQMRLARTWGWIRTRVLIGIVPIALVVAIVATLLPWNVGITITSGGTLSVSIGTAEVYADPGWLSGWDNRREIDIDYTNGIGASVTWFPVSIIIESGVAGVGDTDVSCIFDELTSDANRFKIAVTKADGNTELYVEIEQWDDANENAVLHVSRDGWTIDSDTSMFIYYDSAQDDNTTYIKDYNTVVWDTNFKLVDHLGLEMPQTPLEISTATYDYPGLLILIDSDTVLHVHISGADHFGTDAVVKKRFYTISTASWGSETTIWSDGSYEAAVASGGGGEIGSDIFFFFVRRHYDDPGFTYTDVGYIKSSDDGANWDSFVTVKTMGELGLDAAIVYGPMAGTSNAATFLQTLYGLVDSTYEIKTLRTTDSGSSWDLGDDIYSGATGLTETAIAYIGDSKMIALSRIGTYVQQATSADNGTNWTAFGNTNLGAATDVKIPYIIYDDVTGEAICIFHDRYSTGTTYISRTQASTVYASASAWTTPLVWVSGFDLVGYPIILKINLKEYFIIYAQEKSSSDCDNYSGYYLVRDSTSNCNDLIARSMETADFVAAKIGKGASLDGVVEYLSVRDDSSLRPTDKITVSIWAYIDPAAGELDGKFAAILTKWDSGTANKGYYLAWDDRSGVYTNALRFGVIHAVGDYGHAVLDNAISSAGWYHIVGTYDKDLGGSEEVKLYLDSAKVATDDYAETIGTNSYEVRLGALATTLDYNFEGKLDEARISDDCRSAAWVKASYNSGNDSLLTYGDITNLPSSNNFGTLEVNTTSPTAINKFTITNNSGSAVSITIQATDLTGGDDTWTLSDTATPGENIYGLKAGLDDDDDLFDVIVKKTATYNTLVSGLADEGTQDWGLKLYMPTTVADYDNQEMAATVTLVASCD